MQDLWRNTLIELRRGINSDANAQKLMQQLSVRPRRRLYVQVLLAQARQEKDPERASEYAAMAADLLYTFLKKPRLAQHVYRFAAQKAANPQPILLAAKAIAEQLGGMGGEVDEESEGLKVLATKALSLPTDENIQQLRMQAADLLLQGRPSKDRFAQRIDACFVWLLSDRDFLKDALAILRAREYHDGIVHLLSKCIDQIDARNSCELRLQLGHTLRFGLGNAALALDCFEAVLAIDPQNREAWGELLECLDDIGEHERLARALKQRIALTSGLEREQLERQRVALLKTLGRREATL